MATAEEHAQDAAEYLEYADEILDRKPAIAGEAVWGAAIQAAQSVIPETSTQHHSQNRKGIINAIGRSGATKTQQLDLANIADRTAKTLHNGFYHPRQIDPVDHQEVIADARLLINHLTRHARRTTG